MKRYHSPDGKSTPWISDEPTKKELERLNIDQLLLIARNKVSRKKSLKGALIDYLLK